MKYLLICGGVGGAKLALGFSKAIEELEELLFKRFSEINNKKLISTT